MLVCPSDKGSRCINCNKLRHTLNRMYTRQQNEVDTDRTHPKSHTNYRYLSSHQKCNRLHQLHKLCRVNQQCTNRLRLTIEKFQGERAMEVDDDLMMVTSGKLSKRRLHSFLILTLMIPLLEYSGKTKHGQCLLEIHNQCDGIH